MSGRILLPASLEPENVVAIVDSREQLAYDLAPLRMQPGTLDAGDYSVRGLESFVTVERKSLPDFVACCGVERERFEREIKRLRGYECKAVVVEATWADLEAGAWRSKITSQSVTASALGWIASGVPFVLAGSREAGERYTAKLLYLFARRRWREAKTLINGTLNSEAKTE